MRSGIGRHELAVSVQDRAVGADDDDRVVERGAAEVAVALVDAARRSLTCAALAASRSGARSPRCRGRPHSAQARVQLLGKRHVAAGPQPPDPCRITGNEGLRKDDDVRALDRRLARVLDQALDRARLSRRTGGCWTTARRGIGSPSAHAVGLRGGTTSFEVGRPLPFGLHRRSARFRHIDRRRIALQVEDVARQLEKSKGLIRTRSWPPGKFASNGSSKTSSAVPSTAWASRSCAGSNRSPTCGLLLILPKLLNMQLPS